MKSSSAQKTKTGVKPIRKLLTYARLGLAVFVGFTANHFYYKHCRQKIEKLRGLSSGGSENEYYQTLAGGLCGAGAAAGPDLPLRHRDDGAALVLSTQGE